MNASSNLDFPKLTKELIQSEITFGSYQLRQSLGYLDEHFKNGKYDIMISKDIEDFQDGKLIYAHIQSRHKNNTKYKCYVKYLPFVNDKSGVNAWYCTCPNGNRTVGCCVHLTSII